jgi:DNA-binding protein H-NS
MPTEFVEHQFQFNDEMVESSREISRLYEDLLSRRKEREKQLFNELSEIQHEMEKYTEQLKYRKHRIDECMMSKAHCEIVLKDRKS